MECTKCHKILNLTEFSYKNVKEKIYYLYCDNCRKKVAESQKKYKEKMKDDYDTIKISNKIECRCGISYVGFRNYHIKRHESTTKHIMAMSTLSL
jgi:hypothetical protein